MKKVDEPGGGNVHLSDIIPHQIQILTERSNLERETDRTGGRRAGDGGGVRGRVNIQADAVEGFDHAFVGVEMGDEVVGFEDALGWELIHQLQDV